ncbi:MAG: hypothetical protein ABIX01_22280 [Chitinophagaceae bacterium]
MLNKNPGFKKLVAGLMILVLFATITSYGQKKPSGDKGDDPSPSRFWGRACSSMILEDANGPYIQQTCCYYIVWIATDCTTTNIDL